MKCNCSIDIPNIQTIEVKTGASSTEYLIAAELSKRHSPESVFALLAGQIAQLEASVISMDVLTCHPRAVVTSALKTAFGTVNWPVMWVPDGSDADSTGGVSVWATTAAVKPIRVDGHVIGCRFSDGFADYCRLGGIIPDQSMSREQQAKTAFETMEMALASAGMAFSDVIRTWFFLGDIHAWYGDFNKVRNAFFTQRGVFDDLLPAGTGIGLQGKNAPGVVAGLLAVRPTDGVKIREVSSPLQGPAPEYGSSFSRAVEIVTPEYNRLMISGTASIAADGLTMHTGDIDRQIKLTMDVVEAILKSRDMTWQDVTRAIVYLQNSSDLAAYNRFMSEKAISFPAVIVQTDVCRDDLLFEIEVDAGVGVRA